MGFKEKKFNRRLLTIYIFITLLCNISCLVVNEEDCPLFYENDTEVTKKEWEKGILLPEINDTIEKRQTLINMKTDTLTVKNIYVNKKDFQDHYYIDKHEKFELFAYDFDLYEEYESEINMTIHVEFWCKNQGVREITFKQPIIDTNNHDPEFLKTSYNYTLPMPLTKGFEFSPHDPIIVRDIDLTNENIIFELKPQIPGLSVSFLGKDLQNVKNHWAKFEVTDMVHLENDVSLTLYATDSGIPPRTTNTTINIKVDVAHSLPRFSHSLYTADLTLFYNRKKERIPLRFTPGQIKLIQGYEENYTFEINGIAEDYKKHFQIIETTESDSKCVQIELVDLPTDFWDHQQDFFIFLKATKDSFEATTVLYIRLPGSSNTVVVSEVHVDVANKTIGAALGIVAIFFLCFVLYVFLIKQRNTSYNINKAPDVQNNPVQKI